MLQVVRDEQPAQLDDGPALHLPGVAHDWIQGLLPLVGRHVGGGGCAEGTAVDVHLGVTSVSTFQATVLDKPRHKKALNMIAIHKRALA